MVMISEPPIRGRGTSIFHDAVRRLSSRAHFGSEVQRVAVGQKIFNWLFGCRHRQLSRAFTAEGETYRVCLKCGARLRYSWQTMSLIGNDAKGKARRAGREGGAGTPGERKA
jgi:hypothetical protein